MHPQRLLVPLFQRPYVWNEENQWAPLWDDVARVAERLLDAPNVVQQPHFLGAVVLQQVFNAIGAMQERIIIDGQQRLTTLQLLLDALHAELDQLGATQQALRIETLILNAAPFCEGEEDRFKVWPTNRDRAAFNCIMGAELPVAYDELEFAGARLVEAHRFFSGRLREWLLAGGADDAMNRASAIERTVRELLQIVVIDLTADENAQEIFETLNARGSQLTAADLIKNFIFQRLTENGDDVEHAYEQSWKTFETGFWETEVSFGRILYSRSSIFLNHWLIAQTGEDLVAREVFSRFKRYTDFGTKSPMVSLLAQIDRAAMVYRRIVEGASNYTEPIDRIGLFAYRTGTLDSEVFKPVLLMLLDPELPPIDAQQLNKALEALESWMVRRMLIRANTKGYNQLASELVRKLRESERASAGDVVESFLKGQTAASRYWPDDDEVRRELTGLMVYRRLRRGRLRMVLEAIEDHRRGWIGDQKGLGGQRVSRGSYAIEHVMPRSWAKHWPLPEGESDRDRDQLVHTLGNLTLLTSAHNSKVSNGPWSEKRGSFEEHNVIKINQDLLTASVGGWDEPSIRVRTAELVSSVLMIWPAPEGHKSPEAVLVSLPKRKIGVIDLIGADLLQPGTTLTVRRKPHGHRIATVLPDGRIDVDGVAYDTPSGAARSIYGKQANGWRFFRVGASEKRLSDIWFDYVEELSIEADDDEIPDGDGDDDES